MRQNVLIGDACTDRYAFEFPMCTLLCDSRHIHGPMIYTLIPAMERDPRCLSRNFHHRLS